MTPGIKTVNRLAANATKTASTVLASIGIPVPAKPLAKHHIRYWLPYSQTGTAAGIGFELINPAAITSMLLSFVLINCTTGLIDSSGVQSAAALFTGTGASAGNYLAMIEVDIINGANAGNFDLQFAQKVSDAGVITILAGGWVEDTII